MEKISTLIAAVLIVASLWAQGPEKMSYQAVIRNASNNLVTSAAVGMKISILQGSANGTVVYTETQTPTTNANGLASIEIGSEAGFNTINWANGPYFIKTETDPTGGTSYTITGTSQLLSVPYALHAKTAETVTGGITETDPMFTSSQAANITATDITKLSNLSGTNTGDQDGSETKVTAGTNVTVTGAGTTISPYVINTSTGGGGFTHYIGEQYGGGVIFHLWKDNAGIEHGLIVALTDQSTTQLWSNVTSTAIGTSARSSWNGLSNSNAIVGQATHTSSAAKLCLDLVSGEQSDWYLPSIQELNMLWNNYYTVARSLYQIGGATQLVDSYYWSSSENTSTNAWAFLFLTGSTIANGKTGTFYVRAVRAF